MPTKKIQLAIIYESDRGGETKATQHISTSLEKNILVDIKKLQLEPLLRTSFKRYFSWLLYSIYKTHQFLNTELSNNQSVVYTTTFTAGFATILYNFKKPIQLIFHYHGSRIPTFEKNITQFLKFFSAYILQALVFSFAKKIIVTSKYSKERIVTDFPHIKKEKIIIIDNGIDLQEFRTFSKLEKIKNRKKYQLKNNEIAITNISRMVNTKGIIKLLYVFARLQKKYQNLHLFLVYPTVKNNSENNYKKKVSWIIKNKNIQPVTLIENANMPEIYALSDLLVSFSEEENYPLVLLEAYASHTKFVTSNKEVLALQKKLSKKDGNDLSWDTVASQILKLV